MSYSTGDTVRVLAKYAQTDTAYPEDLAAVGQTGVVTGEFGPYFEVDLENGSEGWLFYPDELEAA